MSNHPIATGPCGISHQPAKLTSLSLSKAPPLFPPAPAGALAPLLAPTPLPSARLSTGLSVPGVGTAP